MKGLILAFFPRNLPLVLYLILIKCSELSMCFITKNLLEAKRDGRKIKRKKTKTIVRLCKWKIKKEKKSFGNQSWPVLQRNSLQQPKRLWAVGTPWRSPRYSEILRKSIKNKISSIMAKTWADFKNPLSSFFFCFF